MDREPLGKQLEGALALTGAELDETARRQIHLFDSEGQTSVLSYAALASGLIAGDLAIRHRHGRIRPRQLDPSRNDFELPLSQYEDWFGRYLGRCVFDYGTHSIEDPNCEGYIGRMYDLARSCKSLLRMNGPFRRQFRLSLRRVLAGGGDPVLRIALGVFLETWERTKIPRELEPNFYRLFCAYRTGCAMILSIDAGVLAQESVKRLNQRGRSSGNGEDLTGA